MTLIVKGSWVHLPLIALSCNHPSTGKIRLGSEKVMLATRWFTTNLPHGLTADDKADPRNNAIFPTICTTVNGNIWCFSNNAAVNNLGIVTAKLIKNMHTIHIPEKVHMSTKMIQSLLSMNTFSASEALSVEYDWSSLETTTPMHIIWSPNQQQPRTTLYSPVSEVRREVKT